jgi:predicted DNA-binding protein
MSPRKSENPKERKVTARFTAEEVERLALEAKRRGEPISSLVRDLVVTTIDEVEAKLKAGKRS